MAVDGGTGLLGRGLARRLAGRIVLDRIDVAIPGGAVTALVGPNGAGKSTLLRLLAGIDRPDGGQTTLDGVHVGGLGARERARRIAHMPQVAPVHWPLVGRDVVALGRLPHGASLDRLSADDEHAVACAIARTDTASLAGRRVDTLSAGETARLMLARALATGADALLADEPVASLDPARQIEALALLRSEAGRGVAVAVVLHDLALAGRFADHVVVLTAGRVAASGAARDVLMPATLEAVYGVRFVLLDIDGVPVPVAVGR